MTAGPIRREKKVVRSKDKMLWCLIGITLATSGAVAVAKCNCASCEVLARAEFDTFRLFDCSSLNQICTCLWRVLDIMWCAVPSFDQQSYDLKFSTRDDPKCSLIEVILVSKFRQIKDFTRHLTGHFTSLVLNTRRLLEWLTDIPSIGNSLTANNSVHSQTDLPV